MEFSIGAEATHYFDNLALQPSFILWDTMWSGVNLVVHIEVCELTYTYIHVTVFRPNYTICDKCWTRTSPFYTVLERIADLKLLL